MIIDDTLLIQVYSTVLAGILIFFTIQRHFEYTEEFERASSRLLKQRENAIEEIRVYKDALRRLTASRDKNVELAPSYYNRPDVKAEFESEKNRLERLINKKGDEFVSLNKNLYSRAMKYRKRHSQYISLKTDEGILAAVMVLLVVASIVVLLVGSIIELYPLPEGMPPSARIISVVLFSIGIILLIGKVYLHGKEID
ncbi:MAG: hypothetical protein ACRD5J_16980 [Nitrososphaeraceae archaeon]